MNSKEKETWKRSKETKNAHSKKQKVGDSSTANNNNKQKIFQYGNYNRYYGYRNANREKDKRIDVFQRDWFEGKTCLDIGCNVGHLTLWISKYFKVQKMRGVDIDCHLIQSAKNNMTHYVDDDEDEMINTHDDETVDSTKNNENMNGENIVEDEKTIKNDAKENNERKDIEIDSNAFPNNVAFVTENIVPASDNVLKYTKPQYDVIMCLSVTKWIQLNEGDDGLKRLFKKIYKLLNVGGIFILEPQPFNGYRRRKNLTPTIRKNFDNMKLLPDKFIDYLLSDEVGFKSAEAIEATEHEKEGFQRPIYIVKK